MRRLFVGSRFLGPRAARRAQRAAKPERAIGKVVSIKMYPIILFFFHWDLSWGLKKKRWWVWGCLLGLCWGLWGGLGLSCSVFFGGWSRQRGWGAWWVSGGVWVLVWGCPVGCFAVVGRRARRAALSAGILRWRLPVASLLLSSGEWPSAVFWRIALCCLLANSRPSSGA